MQSGRLFHIDFGYILGRDPKPMPPPMKLSKEMIEAFGGMQSDHFQVKQYFRDSIILRDRTLGIYTRYQLALFISFNEMQIILY